MSSGLSSIVRDSPDDARVGFNGSDVLDCLEAQTRGGGRPPGIPIVAQSADRRRGTNRVPNFTNRFNCRRSYDIRLFDDLLWWPVLDIDNAPRAAEEFLNGLADGEYKSLGILHYNIAPYWSSAKPTFKEAFQHLTKYEVSRTTEEKQVALALRGAAEAMICEGALYVLAGTPMYFACASTLLGNRELSVEVGPSSLKDLPNTGNHIVGPQAEKRKRALSDANVIDIRNLYEDVGTPRTARLCRMNRRLSTSVTPLRILGM